MSSRIWTSRSLVVTLIAAASVIVGVSASPTGSVGATNQQRVTGTSPVTGVTYSLIHSCMTQMPSATTTQPDRDVSVKLEVIRDGEVFREVNDIIDHRDDDNRLDFQRRFFLEPAGTEGVSYRIRDVFNDDFPAVHGAPFLTLVPEPCPDYNDDERGSFAPIDPVRVLDTRPDQATNYSGSKPAARSSVNIPASVMPDRPEGVLAVSLTVTIIQPDGRSFAQVYPAGTAEPGTSSNVNTPGAGVNIANGAVVPVAADGSISVYTSGRSHLAVDINGYFVAQSAAVGEGRLETIEPKRVLDTRPEFAVNTNGGKPGPASTTRVDLTLSESGLPAGARAAVVNITATRTSGRGFVQAARAGDLTIGESSVLNVTGLNQSVAGLSIVPVSADGEIDVYTLGGADLIVDLFGWFTGDDAEVSESGLFVPLTPERIFDSRRATSMNPNTFTDDFSGCCSGSDAALEFQSLIGKASAVFLNATAIGTGARGFIRIGESATSNYSSVNFPEFGAVANAALVPVDDLFPRARLIQQGAARAGMRPALAVDISGYFTL